MPPYFPYDVGDPPASAGLVEDAIDTPLGRVHVLRPRTATPTVMFLHGVSLDSTSWTPLLRAAATYDVPWLLVDIPGFGRSEPLAGPTSLDQLCGALVAVADHLGLDRLHVVGHSMGGFVGLHLAATCPERVRTLATLNGSYVTILDLVNAPLVAAARHPGTWFAYQAVRAVAGGGGAVQRMVRMSERAGLMRWGTVGLAAHPSRLPRSLLHALVTCARPASFRYAEATGIGYDWPSAWSRIDVPVLAGYGARDRLVTSRDARALLQAIPAAREVVVPDSAHLSRLEQPDRWYAELSWHWATA